MRSLVLGATGYIGARLVPALLDEGHEVRCLVRDPGKLAANPWGGRVEAIRGDLLHEADVRAAVEGVDVVHYLAHAMGQDDFPGRDRRAAGHVAAAASAAGVRRIVYLGGIRPGGSMSEHLGSRAEVGDILLGSGVPTVVLQAAMVTGTGSASFEILRGLTDRLPVMLVPAWAGNRTQPIALDDVLRYLVRCADLDASVHRAFDVGGPDVLSYREMIQRYARVAGLPRRVMVGFPLPLPGLSGRFISAVTAVPAALVAPLLDSLAHEMVCREHDIAEHVPDPAGGLRGFEEAVRTALGAGPDGSDRPTLHEERTVPSDAPARRLWDVVESIGGDNGWYSPPGVWELRGLADHAIGGVGAHRVRRDPDRLRVGDVVDSWRVEGLDRGRLLRLRSDMTLPGRAWLQFEVRPGGLHQRVEFAPDGLLGQAYWALVRPLHGAVFGTMARNLVRAAERTATGEPPVRGTGRHPT